MATKKNFTQSVISSTKTTTDTSDTRDTENTTKRHYKRKDPREEPAKEVRFTARVPGDLYQYLQARANMNYTSVAQTLADVIAENRDAHPEVVKRLEHDRKTTTDGGLKKEQKKRQGN